MCFAQPAENDTEVKDTHSGGDVYLFWFLEQFPYFPSDFHPKHLTFSPSHPPPQPHHPHKEEGNKEEGGTPDVKETPGETANNHVGVRKAGLASKCKRLSGRCRGGSRWGGETEIVSPSLPHLSFVVQGR